MEPLSCQSIDVRRRWPGTTSGPAALPTFRLLALVALLIAFGPAPLPAGEAAPPALERVRVAEPHLASLLRAGAGRSATMRRLVDAIDASDLIVYVERNNRFLRSEAGRFRLLARAGDVRYARIELSTALNDRELTMILAHELQHAAELAAAPGVDTQRGMLKYFGRIGDQWPYLLDTARARAVTERVGEELGYNPLRPGA